MCGQKSITYSNYYINLVYCHATPGGGESSVKSILNEKMTAISISEKRGWTSINKAYTSVRKLIFMV